MNSLKVSSRLALLASLLVLLLVVVGGLGLAGLDGAQRSLRAVSDDRLVPLAQLAELQQLRTGLEAALREAVDQRSGPAMQQAAEVAAANLKRHNQVWDAFQAPLREGLASPDELRLAEAVAASHGRFAQEAVAPLLTALQARDFPRARALLGGPLPDRLAALRLDHARLVQAQVDLARERSAVAGAAADRMRQLTVVALLAGVLAGIVAALAIGRGLVRQLGAEPAEAVRLAHAIAHGDLTTAVALRADDRTSLMAALRQMRDSLLDTVAVVRRDADDVSQACGEIAQGTQTLNHRTEEQAGALQQTTASMEQLTAHVHRHADHAQSAQRLAEGAVAVARRGGAAVGEVVGTMQGIEDSSRRIAEIMGTIDGIAFQTNTLALNAAVEASRAGEQGQGFAVVASEVRGLAQRSSQAAREVRALIDESVGRVDAGARRVAEAGRTMQEVEGAILRLHTLVAEIGAAGLAQRAGVQQIGQAVSQIDRVTQHNAALVQQHAATAAALREQAQHLLNAVSAFRLDGTEPAR